MYVELPETGCNILSSSSSFYNYSTDRRTRRTYHIFDGKAFLSSESTSSQGYIYSGDCLVTGDLVYEPEVRVYFPIISFCLIFLLTYFVFNIIIKRLMP